MPHNDARTDSQEFYYDRAAQRYRYGDTKRFAPRAAVQSLRAKQIKKAEDATLNQLNDVIGGKKHFLEWQVETLEQIKTLHIQNYILGRGGVDRVNSADWLTVANELRVNQMPRFRAFMGDLKLGKLSEKQAKARLRLYLRSAKLSYAEAFKESAVANGGVYARRSLGVSEHCPECLLYAAMGIKKIEKLPLPGHACTCNSSCNCSIQFFSSLEDAVKNVAISYL